MVAVQQFTRFLRHFPWQRIPKWIRFNRLLIVDVDTQFQKATADHFDVNIIFPTQLARHPGGNKFLCRSNGAISNLDLSHDAASFVWKQLRFAFR
ncbi:MAG TPA: hypothetical protein VGP81_03895 [Pyrinomonadaceae bacterium]|jgi:hypothetical protein|nr:hypothetical protein [Pyrinomonadaceae bacterium]